MKILFLGNFEAEHSSENYYLKTFRKLGHEVVTLQEGKATSRDIVRNSGDIGMFFWVKTHGWNTQGITSILKDFKVKGIPTVGFHLDLYMGLQRWKQYEHGDYFQVEHFFTVDKLMADWLNQNTQTKGYFLPAGVFEDECFLGTPNKEKYPHDIIFTGAKGYHPEWPYRPQLIDWLQANYGSRFGHYGNGGMAQVRGVELNNLYASAKIVIGDTLCKDFNYPWYSSDRLFEVCGRGGFLIYPYITGLETFYEAGEEIEFYEFGDFFGLKQLVNKHLENDKQREQMRVAAFERTIHEHTYTNRLQTILNTIKP
jgi:hypothetical protein